MEMCMVIKDEMDSFKEKIDNNYTNFLVKVRSGSSTIQLFPNRIRYGQKVLDPHLQHFFK